MMQLFCQLAPLTTQDCKSCPGVANRFTFPFEKLSLKLGFCFFSLQVNVIHTASPVEHANNAMVQPNFINPVHHASVDLSGHNLVNAHQASGTKICLPDMKC